MIIGIDIGGTTTDAVAILDGKVKSIVSVHADDPFVAASGALGKLLNNLNMDVSDVNKIATTGAGSNIVGKRLLNRPVRRVDEVTSIGLGGITISNKKQALVVSMGTGTALVTVHDNGKRIEHLGGSGVGGGTLMGLSKIILHKNNFESLEKLARLGELKNVDLSVGDLVGGPLGRIPAHATASNFGNITDDATDNDLALGIVNMVGQVLGSVVVFASIPYSLEEDIVLTGKVTRNELVVKKMQEIGKLFNTEMIVPKHADYCAAIGAATSLLGTKKNKKR